MKSLIIFILSLSSIYGQLEVTWLNSTPGGSEIKKIFMLNNTTIFTVAEWGTFSFSDNLGKTWVANSNLANDSYCELRDVLFFDKYNGIILRAYNEIFLTEDRGDNWLTPEYPNVNIIYSFISTDSLIIATADNGILKSNDLGKTWVYENLGYNVSFRKAMKINDSEIILISNNLVLYSSDGGISWGELYQSNDRIVDSYFISSSVGFVTISNQHSYPDFSYHNKILKTDNGGQSWNEVFSSDHNEYRISDIKFLNNTNGIAGVGNKLLITRDCGISWETIDVGSKINSIYAYSEYNVIIGGNNLFRSTDMGENWTELYPRYSLGGEIEILDENNVYFFSKTTIQKSNLEGHNWTPVSWTNKSLNSPSFVSPNIGYAIGDSRNVYKTINGGESWESNYSINNGGPFLWDIKFYNENLGIALGSIDNVGIILKTEDGGNSWSLVHSNVNGYLFAVRFYDKNNCFAVGAEGTILHSSDGGTSWENVISGTNEFLRDICFLNAQKGYCIGENGTLLKSEDNGKSWEKLDLGITNILNSISFSDERFGVIVGYEGILLITHDGGQSWSKERVSNAQLNEVVVFNNTAFVSGLWCAFKFSEEGSTNAITDGKPIQNFTLNQNYPNPFNSFTIISYSIPQKGDVVLKIYNILGREIATLLDKEQEMGTYKIQFDASYLSSGVYFYRLQSGNYAVTKKLILLR